MISDDELNRLLAPSNQPYDGPLTNQDPISRNLALLGQLNPVVDRELAAEHGRYLSGFGEASMDDKKGKEPVAHADVADMEEQDDVVGSGIFDPHGRQPTVNADMGVFGAHYSIPGNHAREVPFTVNHEIRDLATGADVVGIPSGGLNYVEHGDALPYLDPTNTYEPYARPGVGGKGWDADSTLAPAEAMLDINRPTSRGGKPIPMNDDPKLGARRSAAQGGFVAPGHMPRDPMFSTNMLPSRPGLTVAPMSPAGERLPRTPTVYASMPQVPAAERFYAQSVPVVPYQNIDPHVHLTQAVEGFGSDGFNPGDAAKYAALLVFGGAVGYVVHSYMAKKGK